MKIMLIRHAGAEPMSEQWEGRDDERPLTQVGIRRFRRAVKGIRRLGLAPTVVLTSPLVRARHSASWLLAGLRQSGLSVVVSESLRPDAPPELPPEVMDMPSDSLVVLIGHNPHLQHLAVRLLLGRDEGLRFNLKKGGMMILDIDDPSKPGTATLSCLMTQRQLRHIS